MGLFGKYILWFFSFFTLAIYSLLYTSFGHSMIGSLLGSYYSDKTGDHLEVYDFEMDNYPLVSMSVTINNGAKVFLKGMASFDNLEMDYHLVGDFFDYGSLHIKDKIDITGTVSGSVSNALVTGKGRVFDGTTQFNFLKISKRFEDMNINLVDVNITRIAIFLDYKPLFEGKADIDVDLKYFSTYKKRGTALISMKEAMIPSVSGNVPFIVTSHMRFADMEYFYNMDIKSPVGNIIVKEGYFHKSRKEAKANYAIEIEELAYFQNLLKGSNYQGDFFTSGSIHYDEELSIKGRTKKFDGVTQYSYSKDKLDITLEGITLLKLLKFFSYPSLLDAKVYGVIDIDLKDKMVFLNTQLKETRFRRTKMRDMILNSTGIDVLAGVYDKSSFVGGYQNSVLHSTLKIDNGVKHLYLTNTRMNSKNNHINSDFELQVDGEKVYGEIYGTLQEPEVSINVQKLLKRKLGNWLGTNKKKAIKTEPVKVDNSFDMDKVKEKAKTLLDSFF